MLIASNMTSNSSLFNSSMTTHFDGWVVNGSMPVTWTTPADAATNATASTLSLSTSAKTPFYLNVTSGSTIRDTTPNAEAFVTSQSTGVVDTMTARVVEDLMDIGNSRMTVLTVYLTVAFSIVLFVMLFMWICCRSHQRFRQIAVSRDQLYEYIYSPLHPTEQDDEYENTYVGISIPLLQDNTKV